MKRKSQDRTAGGQKGSEERAKRGGKIRDCFGGQRAGAASAIRVGSREIQGGNCTKTGKRGGPQFGCGRRGRRCRARAGWTRRARYRERNGFHYLSEPNAQHDQGKLTSE